jgi:hypothetical protein
VRDAFVRTVLVMVATVLLVTGCKEDFESRYPTVEAAAQAGAFKRGWLPAVLQPDATEIQEWHDLDSNKVRGRFALNDSLLYRLQRYCKVSEQETPIGSGPSWWPNGDSRGKSAANFHVVRCGDYFVATDRENRVGYFWANVGDMGRTSKSLSARPD